MLGKSDLMPSAFVSYVRENRKAVDRLCAALRGGGIQVWLDRSEILPGVDWKVAIRQAIQSGDYFIACFSQQYGRRKKTYMNTELSLAIEELSQTKAERPWFIPVLLSNCEVPDLSIGGTRTLRDLQSVKLFRNWSVGTNAIISAILKSSSSNVGMKSAWVNLLPPNGVEAMTTGGKRLFSFCPVTGKRIPLLGIVESGVFRTPDSVARQLGFASVDVWRDWLIEQGFGDYLGIFDRQYLNAGAFSEKRDRP
jgi:TIR domain-containing protein